MSFSSESSKKFTLVRYLLCSGCAAKGAAASVLLAIEPSPSGDKNCGYSHGG
jgi:hypothetical protein